MKTCKRTGGGDVASMHSKMWLPVIDTAKQSGIWSHDRQGRRAIHPTVYAALDQGGRLVIEPTRIPDPDRDCKYIAGPDALYVRCGQWRLGRIPDGAAAPIIDCIRRLALEHLPCRVRPDAAGDMSRWFEVGVEVQIVADRRGQP